MPSQYIRAPRINFGSIVDEMELPKEFSLAAQQAAVEAIGAPAQFPNRIDRTEIPFVTIDPVGSMDLDQAVALDRTANGYRVYYAIADVAAFTPPEGPLRDETWQRGETVYIPDHAIPLHPLVLSENAASLLPDQNRLAVLWTIDLDSQGMPKETRVERATVRSRAQLDYLSLQEAFLRGKPPEPVALLVEIGELLVANSLARGAIDVRLPEQVVSRDGEGWRLELRAPSPVEQYNAQISLLTGAAAAQLMLDGGVGLLRTLPPARAEDLAKARKVASGLGVDWPADEPLGAVLNRVDVATPAGAAFADLAASLLRGAGYTAFDGAPPEQPVHAGVGGTYAHVTAPLRRLADRYATEVCLALHAGQEPPDWARSALPELPRVMAEGGRRAGSAERAVIDLTEAVLLADRVGEDFAATVLDLARDGASGTVALQSPPVRARSAGPLTLGERLRVVLTEADPTTRRIAFRSQQQG